jgi:hypothetical protein
MNLIFYIRTAQAEDSSFVERIGAFLDVSRAFKHGETGILGELGVLARKGTQQV